MSTISRTRKTDAPNTRRIGIAKLELVYWAAGEASGKPQSQIALRRVARVANRWIVIAVNVAEPARNSRINSPLYELRLFAIGTIDSQGRNVCCGIASPTSMCATGASA